MQATASLPYSSGAARSIPTRKSEFIASRGYDYVFFILSPILALVFAESIDGFAWPFEPTDFLGGTETRVTFFIAIWTYAHVFAVVFRSYGNPVVFRHYRRRLLVFPPVAMAGLMVSDWLFTATIVLISVWDVYHTAMQTFGFCRIYDSKLGNSPEAGRRLDLWMNIVLYVGPYVAALGLIGVAEGFNGFIFGNAGPAESWREAVQPGAPLLAIFILVGGSLFSLYYLYAYWKLSRDGYRLSPQKVVLLLSTGAVSVYVWTFRPPVEAFFVSNLFHALQYFALLWASDRGSIQRVFGLAGRVGPGWLALVPFVIVAGGAGVLYESSQQHLALHWAAAAAMVMSVMHFWYDGFVWSVRKREVT